MEVIKETDESSNASFNINTFDTDDGDGKPIKEYMRFVKVCMKVMAMIPIFECDKIHCRYINMLYILFVDFISVYIFSFSAVDLIFSWDGNLFKITLNMINTLIYATNTLLLFYFQLYRDVLRKLMNNMNSDFQFISAEGLTRLNMRGSFEKAKKYSIIFTICCLCGALHWAIEPMITKSENGTRLLPLKIWYPGNVQLSPYYELAYLSQIFGQVMVALVFSNFGVFFMSECVLICGQFDVLCCSLRNLRYTVLLRKNFHIAELVALSGYTYAGENRCTLPDDEYKIYFSGEAKVMDPLLKEKFKNFKKASKNTTLNSFNQELEIRHVKNLNKVINSTFEEKTMEIIKDCVKHHQKLLKYCCQFEAFNSPIALVKMLQITLLACVTMYAFSASFQIPILEYGALTCSDLFLLCYFGNEVKIRSRNVKEAIFGGPWQLLGTQSLRTLLPLIIRSNRPISFTGGKFYSLTLENYIAVLKVSFSYFTVLRNINESQFKT